MIQIKTFPNGAHTVIEADCPRHFWTVKCYRPDGELYDKIRCDDYRNALDYLRAFKKIAKNF